MFVVCLEVQYTTPVLSLFHHKDIPVATCMVDEMNYLDQKQKPKHKSLRLGLRLFLYSASQKIIIE